MSQLINREQTSEDADLERFRPELTGYCYRMLGSVFDADDAVQETLVRAWQKIDTFEGRSSLRSWLYRIATNVCLDSLRSKQRRALPMDLSEPVPPTTAPDHALPDQAWLQPITDAELAPATADPADRVVARDSIRLAFVAALQHLPPRQRAVLVLREVLCWPAAEVAELLDTTVASVNSALQRARATIAAADMSSDGQAAPLGSDEQALLQRYVKAFEGYDMDGLVALLAEDASMSMPPLSLWLRGRDHMIAWYTGYGAACEGSRLVPLQVNGSPGFAHYKPSDDGTRHEPWCIQVLEISAGKVVHIHHFLGAALFERFGLPPVLEPGWTAPRQEVREAGQVEQAH